MVTIKSFIVFRGGSVAFHHPARLLVNLLVASSIFVFTISTNSQQMKLPSFQPHEKTVAVSVGERANLKCRVDNLGDKTVTWKRLNDIHPLTIGLQPFLVDPRIRVDHNQRVNEWNLVISEVIEEDEGVYQCQIITKDNVQAYNITLKLKRVHLRGADNVELGQPVSLQCKASNYRGQPSQVTWFKDDVMLHTGSDVKIVQDLRDKALISQLLITRSTHRDAGLYRCLTPQLDSDSMLVRVRHEYPTVASNLFQEVLRMSSSRSNKLSSKQTTTCLITDKLHLLFLSIVAIVVVLLLPSL